MAETRRARGSSAKRPPSSFWSMATQREVAVVELRVLGLAESDAVLQHIEPRQAVINVVVELEQLGLVRDRQVSSLGGRVLLDRSDHIFGPGQAADR
jgi:hypothetical protein